MTSKLAYAQGGHAPDLMEETIGANLARMASTFGDRIALIDAVTQKEWTYREFREDVLALAAGFVRMGISPGDRVGLWSPNRAEWVLVQYATAEIGVILVNLNPAYRQEELEYALTQSGITAVISPESFKDSAYAAMLEKATPNCPDLRQYVLFDSPEWDAMTSPPSDSERHDVAGYSRSLSPGDAINIQYTSGTTGFPKGATLSHRNILNNGYMVGELLNYTEEDRICLPVPFYHCFGMVMGNLAATTHGAAIVIPAPTFDARATLAAVDAYNCSSLYGVPTMFIAELSELEKDSTRYDLSSLRTGIMAGSPCPEHVMRRVVDQMHMPEVSICYGMTETAPISTQTLVDDPFDLRVGTVGQVGPHLELKVADPTTGQTVERGANGELCVRGYSVMKGYWNDPEKTAQAVDAEGWMHTGDLAAMDDNGYVRITGRIKDMVIRGGENIYPREVEEFLFTHPDIVDVQVVGVPDAKYGEELVAWIRLRNGAPDVTADELRRFATGKIARHKIPRYVQVVDDFPMTVTGKVRKVELREAAIEFLNAQVE
ncbi:putative fatty-acid--CoA ligase [Rhodococcus wratislaviensis NBRC 100605]|uniref:Putative fatty-acid--CoA ligase n=2 Tax=Rhodococcus wratislaviensis TaxID=44752 RepID=X0REM5_RHOWR|nr:putative fatty-acid--CoA ligase [Rhodococcus wratislaviensis NBRC 100605]